MEQEAGKLENKGEPISLMLKPRLFYLDNLRVFLTLLVIVFHTSIAYGAAGSWILDGVDKSELTGTAVLLTIFTAVCQSFFMGLFFFISAFFMSPAYERKGAVRFLQDRLLRLGIPMLVYYFGIGPLTVWFAQARGQLTVAQFYDRYVWSFETTFFGPTWFLEASIYFALLYVLARLMTGEQRNMQQAMAFPTGKVLVPAAILLGCSAFLVRLVYPTGEGPLELQLGYFPSYLLLFVAGLMARRHGWLDKIPVKLQSVWAWVALGMIPVLPLALILTGALKGEVAFEGGWNVQALLYALWEPFVCFGIVLLLLAWFRRSFNEVRPFTSWLAEQAYAVYIIHPAVIVGWTFAFQGVAWPAILKWVVVSVLSIIVCVALAGCIRLIPYVKKVL